jgi:Putative prokaryotic signal transducing protein
VFCPVCENEYDDTYTECPTCGAQLVPNLHGGVETVDDPATYGLETSAVDGELLEDGDEEVESDVEPIPASEFRELVQVWGGAGFAVDLIRSVLEGSGISVLVKGSGMEGVYGGAIDTRIYVRENDADRARDVIRAAEAGEFEIFEDEEG